MLSKLRVLVPLLLVGALLVGGVTAVTHVDASPHHAAAIAMPKSATPGYDVEKTVMVLDDAGAAQCGTNPDTVLCPSPEGFYPIHKPLGVDVQREHVGSLKLVSNDFLATQGWRHLPCFCDHSKFLVRIKTSGLEICYFYVGQCPVVISQSPPVTAYSVWYQQDTYGFFAKPFNYLQIYNFASYGGGGNSVYHSPGLGSCNCAPFVQWYDDGSGPNTGLRYRDNQLITMYGCSASSYPQDLGREFIAGDDMVDSNGNYTMTTWATSGGFINSCVLAYPALNDGTYMA